MPKRGSALIYRSQSELNENVEILTDQELFSYARLTPTEIRVNPSNLLKFRHKVPGESGWINGPITIVNPTTISTSVDPQYSKRPVLGLSHEVLQYIRTPSRRLEFQLFISYHLMQHRRLIGYNVTPVTYKNYWESLVVPFGPGLPPPLVEVSGPGKSFNLDFVGVVDSLRMNFDMLNVKGEPIVYTIDISMTEAPITGLMTSDRVYAEDRGLGKGALGPMK